MSLAETEKEDFSLSIKKAYLSLQEVDIESALWEYRFYNQLLPHLNKYVQTYVLKNDDEKDSFQEGLASYTEKEGRFVTLEKIKNLAREETDYQDFLSSCIREFKRSAKKAKRSAFWFIKRGGAKIGIETLRKIARGEGKTTFSMEQEGVPTSEGEEISLYDSPEALEKSPGAREEQLPDFLIDSRIEDLDKIMIVSDRLYVERTSGKSEKAREKAVSNPKSPKYYYRLLLTAIFLQLYEVYKVIPWDSFLFMLRKRNFMDSDLVSFYEDRGEIPKDAEIARHFNFTEKYLNGRKKDFFKELKTELEKETKKNPDYFSSSLFNNFFGEGSYRKGIETKGGKYESR